MPTIDPSLVPTINPGDLFTHFTTDTSINVRWLTATDPVYFEILNRPIVDTVVRQLILAKAIDDLNTSLGYQAIFPFIIPPQVHDGSTVVNIPVRIFWDFHSSIPVRWTNLRLARIDRLDGTNGSTYTGTLRFIFSAQQYGGGSSTQEIALFFADYEIDSPLTYQRVRVTPANSVAVPGFVTISTGEAVTIDGEIIFRTLDQTVAENQALYNLLAPGSIAQYEMVDSVGGTNPDFDLGPVGHGTGMLTSSAFNLITPVDADPITWLEAFNYPFDGDASRTANDSSGVIIPDAMFIEMDIVAPAADQPTGDTTGAFFPVWISKIERDGAVSTPTLIFYFSTYGIDPVDPTNPIEFATMTLVSGMTAGQVVAVTPFNHLFPTQSSSEFHQEFGRGHVVLSTKWGLSGGDIDDFFNTFPFLVNATSTVTFSITGTRISSWGISRVPKYSPTAGESAALVGTTSDRNTPVYPSGNNKFVTALDEGLGDVVDLDSQSGVTSNAAIDRYGYTGTRAHKFVKLVVDPEQASVGNDPTFYADEILPRLRLLYGRDPVFGDMWYTGSRFMIFNGDSWVG